VLTASALFFISILFGTRSRLAGSLRALFNARGNDETYRVSVALALGMMSHGVMAKTLNVVTSFSILGISPRRWAAIM
jgi:hypothetical protein